MDVRDEYRDDLAACVARAEAAERQIVELTKKPPRVAPRRLWRRRCATWLAENWDSLLLVVTGVTLLGSFIAVIAVIDRHAHDFRSCFVRPVRCKYGNILCSGEHVIVGRRPWNPDFVFQEVGTFKSRAEAVVRAREIGCPTVEDGDGR